MLIVFVKFVSPAYDTSMPFDGLLVFLLFVSTLLILIGGNIINDIFDVETDKINRPKKNILLLGISREKATTLYYSTLILLGICLILIYFKVSAPLFLLLFLVFPPSLLYLYSKYLKSTLLVGNMAIALLSGMVFWIIPLGLWLNQPPALLDDDVFIELAFFSLIAASATLTREIIKDIEDLPGDQQTGYKTTAVRLGAEQSYYLAFLSSLMTLLLLIAMAYFMANGYLLRAVGICFLICTILYISFRILKKTNPFGVSKLLKIFFVLGLILMFIWK